MKLTEDEGDRQILIKLSLAAFLGPILISIVSTAVHGALVISLPLAVICAFGLVGTLIYH